MVDSFSVPPIPPIVNAWNQGETNDMSTANPLPALVIEAESLADAVSTLTAKQSSLASLTPPFQIVINVVI